MDKLQTLLQSLETEFEIKTVPTQEDVASTAGSNIKRLEEARERVQAQLDETFNQIVGYIQFTRASTESLVRLRAHINKEIETLKAMPEPEYKVGQ